MIKRIIAIVAIVVLLAAGYLAYSFLRTPEEASAPIEAIPVQVEAEPSPSEVSSEAPVEEPVVEEAVTEPVAESAELATESPAVEPAAAEAEAASSQPTIFEIVPAQSQARFMIDEVLRGEPFTVVGVTDQVAGQFAVDPTDLSTAQMGPILVNARTLATDNDFRNRAIKNRILVTDQYEFITFTPTAITGLSGAGTPGQSYEFQISGDLTILDTTQPVTFQATATPVSETELQGSASVTILYNDFNLTIPASQAVSAVADEVTLEIDFVANAVEQSS